MAFPEAAKAVAVREAEDGVLVLHPAGRDAKRQAAPAGDVEKGGLLRHMDRVQQRQQQHAGGEAHTVGLGRQASERRQRREPSGASIREMMANGDPAVAEVAREADLFAMLGEGPGEIGVGGMLGIDEEGELHAASSMRANASASLA